MTTNVERLASEISARIVPQLRALAVGESLRVRGYKLVTRCAGEDRFQVEGDTCTQKATEAAFDAVLADLQSHVR